jgi:hypothetical protein
MINAGKRNAIADTIPRVVVMFINWFLKDMDGLMAYVFKR